MRKYSSLDLLRFAKFSKEKENEVLKPVDLIKQYNLKNPELTAKQQIKNLQSFLKEVQEKTWDEDMQNKSCAICGYFCNNAHHFNNFFDITPEKNVDS